MAVEDLEYVERKTGVSLDDEKPLADIRRKGSQPARSGDPKKPQPKSSSAPKSGDSVQPKQPEYDWFEFFLKTGVSPYHCERYASNFNQDSMDESVLPDITPTVLRTLGLKEGDILRVMKYLDNKYNRISAKTRLRNVSFGDEDSIDTAKEADNGTTSPNGTVGGLFSGPGGALRNNTRKGRPAPAVQTHDVVDPKVFRPKNAEEETRTDHSEPAPIPSGSVPAPEKKLLDGFDDDAWDVKPSKQVPATSRPPPASTAPTPSAPVQSALTGSLAELSILSPPLQPTVGHNTGVQPQPQTQPAAQFQPAPQPQPQQQLVQQPQGLSLSSQINGANPSFFSQLTQQQTGDPHQQANPPQAFPLQQNFAPQPFQQNSSQRQRPQAPQSMQLGSLIPPPMRPLSAPQNMPQPSSFGPPPLQQQLTGYQNHSSLQSQVAPPGQSLNELNQMRLQQQQMQPQFQGQGFGQQNPSFGQYSNGIAPQQMEFGQLAQMQQQPLGIQSMQPYSNGQQTSSPFADPRPQQQTGGFQPMINAFLPPALQPQSTGANGFGGRPAFGQPPPPVPPMPQQASVAPLWPQKTGPAPPVRFGVGGEGKKLMQQKTGRRANLSQASKLFWLTKRLIGADVWCSATKPIWFLDIPLVSPSLSLPFGGILLGLSRSVRSTCTAQYMYISSCLGCRNGPVFDCLHFGFVLGERCQGWSRLLCCIALGEEAGDYSVVVVCCERHIWYGE